MLSATSSSVVAAGHSQKVTWPAWASFGGDPYAPPVGPRGRRGPVRLRSRCRPGCRDRHGCHGRRCDHHPAPPPDTPHPPSLPDGVVPRGRGGQDLKAGITSVPMSSMVCMTDSCDTL